MSVPVTRDDTGSGPPNGGGAALPGHALNTAAAVEFRKARSSRVLIWTGVLLAAGITVLATAMVLAARGGNVDVVAKLGPQAATGDWSALVTVATQVTAAADVLAFGVGISWLYGREFADGTVTDLFGLPVSRSGGACSWTTDVCNPVNRRQVSRPSDLMGGFELVQNPHQGRVVRTQ